MNLNFNILIKEINKNNLHAQDLAKIHDIFMRYFLDLYKNIDPLIIGIQSETETYLNSIIEKTIQSLYQDKNLYISCAFIDGKIVGFTIFGPLENSSTILLRTIPIDLTYQDIEIEIQTALLQSIFKKFPRSQKIIMMVRKANVKHQKFCNQLGFIANDNFDESAYLNNTYDKKIYIKFVLNKACL